MNKYQYLCSGCGLCKSISNDSFNKVDGKFVTYKPANRAAKKICDGICVSRDNFSGYSFKSIWGTIKDVYFSYSTNDLIRKKSSSGGTITTLACGLLTEHFVDGVLLVSYQGQLNLKLICCTTAEQIIDNCGSKYIDSTNLEDIFSLIEEGKKYCFIGKPCEVGALKRLSNENAIIKKAIIYYLSFFCAGIPSKSANYKLSEDLGCKKEKLSFIKWRGNGWPGFTEIQDSDGIVYKTSYENAWSNYLGRDTRMICRVCIDSIGELADVSCCDAWYLKNGKPSFEETDGRNLTIVRTEKGSQIVNLLMNNKSLFAIRISDCDDYLKEAQPYQYIKRASLRSILLALRLMGKKVPRYNRKLLKRYSKFISFRERRNRFMGTIKRVLKGKI